MTDRDMALEDRLAEIEARHKTEDRAGGYKDGVGPMGQRLFDDRGSLLEIVRALRSTPAPEAQGVDGELLAEMRSVAEQLRSANSAIAVDTAYQSLLAIIARAKSASREQKGE